MGAGDESGLVEGELRHTEDKWRKPILVGGYSCDGPIILVTSKALTFNKGTFILSNGKKVIFTRGNGAWWPRGHHPSGGKTDESKEESRKGSRKHEMCVR
jgi:hypothetical protein